MEELTLAIPTATSFFSSLNACVEQFIDFVLHNPIGTILALIVAIFLISKLAERSRAKKANRGEYAQEVRKVYTLGERDEQTSSRGRGFYKASTQKKDKAHLADASAFTAKKASREAEEDESQKKLDLLTDLYRQDRVIENARMYYAPKSSFCSDAECRFFKSLEQACEMHDWKVFPKVQIRELCYQKIPKDASDDAMLAWNLVKMKHVDFLICDQQYKPLVALEYDDSTHASDPQTRKSDAFKAAFFAALDIPLVRVPYGVYTPSRLAERISNAT